MHKKRDKYLILKGLSLSVSMALFCGAFTDTANADNHNSLTEWQKHLSELPKVPQIAPVIAYSSEPPWQLRMPSEGHETPVILPLAQSTDQVPGSPEMYSESFRITAGLPANYLNNTGNIDYALNIENYMQYAVDDSADSQAGQLTLSGIVSGFLESFRIAANLPADYLKNTTDVDYSLKLENYMQYAADDSHAQEIALAQQEPQKNISQKLIGFLDTPEATHTAVLAQSSPLAHIVVLPEAVHTPNIPEMTVAEKQLESSANAPYPFASWVPSLAKETPKNSIAVASAQGGVIQSVKIEMLGNTDSSAVPVVTTQSLPLLPPVPRLIPPENMQATAPIPVAAVPIAATPVAAVPVAPAAPDSGISAQSKAILNGLPAEQIKVTKKTKPVDVEHTHPNALEAQDEKTHNGVGIKITIKQPKADITRMLESAYDNLIAGDQEDAITLYKQVLGVQPENKLALFGLATTYHRAGQIQLARPLYGKLLTIDPHNVEGLNNFLVLLADEDPRDALVELDKLEKTHPGLSIIPAQMAIIYEKTGNYSLAADKMNAAIDMTPENLKYRYDMAVILDKKGDWADAALLYKQLLTANARGEKISANPEEIQQRLTFILSNRPKGSS